MEIRKDKSKETKRETDTERMINSHREKDEIIKRQKKRAEKNIKVRKDRKRKRKDSKFRKKQVNETFFKISP